MDPTTEELTRLVNNMSSSALEQAASKLFKGKEYTTDEIKELLQSKGVLDKISGFIPTFSHIDDFINSIKHKSYEEPTIDEDLIEIKDETPDILSLKLSLDTGRAFLYSETPSMIHLEIQLLSDRLSTPKVATCIDPTFGSTFVITLPSPDLHTLLASKSPAIHIVLLQTTTSGERSVLATANVDWRAVLYNGEMSSQVELKDGQVTLGLIDLSISLYGGHHGRLLLRREDVEFTVKRENSERSEKDRVLFSYCRQWWKDYVFINPSLHSTRYVVPSI
jgi:hypothetical protein